MSRSACGSSCSAVGRAPQRYDATTGLAKTYGGAYGLGISYAKAMLGEHASEGGSKGA